MQILFIGFVIVDAEDNVSPADKPKLWSSVVESSHLEHITDSIPIQSWKFM